jgi:hypothetical protein
MIYLGQTFIGQYAPDVLPPPEIVRTYSGRWQPLIRPHTRHPAAATGTLLATATATGHRAATAATLGSLRLTARATARHLPSGEEEALLAAALLN